MNVNCAEQKVEVTSVSLPSDVLARAKTRAQFLKRSFSHHVSVLLEQDFLGNDAALDEYARTKAQAILLIAACVLGLIGLGLLFSYISGSYTLGFAASLLSLSFCIWWECRKEDKKNGARS